MNGLSLANPWMLAGLVAIGLPVLIHFLTRARPRKVVFPPFRFLVEACAGKQAVHRLRTWILLALRTLAVAALVMLFARPFLKPTTAPGAGKNATKAVIVVDASLSMRAVQRGVTLFARAQSEAAEVLRQMDAGAEVGLILAGATPRPLLPGLSRNLPALHDELVKAQPTFEQGDIKAALALAGSMLGGGGTVYIFSDFQKTTWADAKELPSGLICKLRPVAESPVDNLALVNVQLTPAAPVAGEPVEVTCTVFNCSPRPVEESIRLDLGQAPQDRRVAVPAFGTGQAVFTVTFAQPGLVTGSASFRPDDLREDNTRYVAVQVHKALQVLLVSDADAADARTAAFFVHRALIPSQAAMPGVQVIRRHSQDTDRGILETAGLFLLVAPARLTGEAVDIISRRVQEGAGLISVIDGPTAPQMVPTACNPPFQLATAVFSREGDPLVLPNRSMPFETDPADWAGFRFFRHLRAPALPGRGEELLISYPDGSAALTLSTSGKGSVVFVNMPLTPDGGDFIGHPLFPATVHDLLRLLRRGALTEPVTPGHDWVLETSTATAPGFAVRGPDGQTIEAAVLASGRTTRLAMPPASLPGLYEVSNVAVLAGAGVVNADPRESDTRPIAVEELKPGSGTAIHVVRQERELVAGEKTVPLWPRLALAAAVCLALEMLLLGLWRKTGPAPQQPREVAA